MNLPFPISKLISFINKDLYTKKGLDKYLDNLVNRNILDLEDVSLIHGCLKMSSLKARDVMIPRAQITYIHKDNSLTEIIEIIQQSKHSRFPVIDKSLDDISGVLLAKQLFQHIEQLHFDQSFEVNKHLIKTVFVPESKRLDNLLKELRSSHNHMAMVIDEYGSISGLITIEDIIEQIVGEIEDEHYEASEQDIVGSDDKIHFKVKANTSIEIFNEYFHTSYSDDYFDTIGGLIAREFGHIPKAGESIIYNKLEFKTIKSTPRSIELLEVKKHDLK
jgi:magnesium and cobalt transporter